MSGEKRKYRRTEAGRKAWESQQSGLPAAYRRILGLMHAAAYSDEVLGAMQEFSARQVLDWLDELDTLGFVEALPFAAGAGAAQMQQAA
ncbi:MAG: hypothetical protein ACREUH_06725 [Burkholderiales bacterium]